MFYKILGVLFVQFLRKVKNFIEFDPTADKYLAGKRCVGLCVANSITHSGGSLPAAIWKDSC